MLYNAIVLPFFDYCSPLWDNCWNAPKDKLQIKFKFRFNYDKDCPYNLRNTNIDLALPKPDKDFGKRYFSYSAVNLWNKFPLEGKITLTEYTSCLSSPQLPF